VTSVNAASCGQSTPTPDEDRNTFIPALLLRGLSTCLWVLFALEPTGCTSRTGGTKAVADAAGTGETPEAASGDGGSASADASTTSPDGGAKADAPSDASAPWDGGPPSNAPAPTEAAPPTDAGPLSDGADAQGPLLAEDSFTNGTGNWSSELESGGTVKAANGVMDIDVPAGATVWFKQQFSGPIVIQYMATPISAGGPNDNVTDLNAFWCARDVRSPDNLFATVRTGVFADYDYLTTYYVGFGGNLDTSTRMRRYVGEAGVRPLLFDLATPLLVANHTYQVELVANGEKIQYWSDGVLLFDYSDAAPYTSGWFGFRTTNSHFQLAAFTVRRLM
jgi:hypothetical protein